MALTFADHRHLRGQAAPALDERVVRRDCSDAAAHHTLGAARKASRLVDLFQEAHACPVWSAMHSVLAAVKSLAIQLDDQAWSGLRGQSLGIDLEETDYAVPSHSVESAAEVADLVYEAFDGRRPLICEPAARSHRKAEAAGQEAHLVRTDPFGRSCYRHDTVDLERAGVTPQT